MVNKLKEYREENGLTQQQLAEMVGVSRQSVISIEKSQYIPTTVLALKIAAVLKAVEELFMLEKKDWK